MASRTTVSGASTPPLAPVDFFNEYAARMATLFDASALPLTSIGGTVNAVTATLDPALASAGAFVDGMKFTITWAGANTAGVTLAINGGAALPVVDSSGTALSADAVSSGLRSLLEYVGGSFMVLTQVAADTGSGRYFYQFTANGTWNKPAGLDDDRMVFVEAWGAGAGGGSSAGGGGGGGGGWVGSWFRAADVPSSVTVTIGAGGAVNTGGGNTTFGALLTAYGGGRGSAATSGGGGGGGGMRAAGAGTTIASGGVGGSLGGGTGGVGTNPGGVGFDASMEGGGGGGGGGSSVGNAGAGGGALRGGGGGAGKGGTGSSAGGISVFGGSGGGPDLAGSAPGGGGGRNAAGARGEVRVWI